MRVIRDVLGHIPKRLHAVRDMTGSLTFVWPDDPPLDDAKVAALRESLDAAIGSWSAGKEQILIRSEDLLDPDDVLDSPDARRIRVPRAGEADADDLVLIDRLVTNQEWLRTPMAPLAGMKICAAFSIKGGVGRTTAFAVWAWALAREGKRVLVMDLDLESPGIANVLSTELPAYGITDWLVEALAHRPDALLLEECIQPWALNTELVGVVDILPAFGTKTQSYVEKLGRVFGSSFDPDTGYTGFSERLHSMLEAIQHTGKYDIVLVDSRAGLHDIGASVVTRLGAEVLMFARDEMQSWIAYRQLFQHLRGSHAIKWNKQGDDTDLRWRLKMVGAQAEPEETARLTFVQRSYDCWLDLYDAPVEQQEFVPGSEFDLFSFAEDDIAAPHYPIMIPFDPRVRSFHFSGRDVLPSWDLVSSTYGPFLKAATARLFQQV
jgi:Mrp family chromosome partitioning ATPase